MPFLKHHAKCLVLLLVLGSGIIITAPYANFQDFLSQGDHGRDLYAAQAVYRGELPYKDFWWVYGPLMPYYYGLFFKIFGTKISSMILGKLILRILGGILICLGLMEVSSAIAAFLCACWFMLFQQDFFFTYNHLGGIVMILGVAFCLLSYIKKNSSKAAWGALGFIFTLCLIKINFGLAALAVCVITVGVCDFVRRIPFNTAKKAFLYRCFHRASALDFYYLLVFAQRPVRHGNTPMPSLYGRRPALHHEPVGGDQYFFANHPAYDHIQLDEFNFCRDHQCQRFALFLSVREK